MPGHFSSACDSSEEVRGPSRDWSETFRKHEPSSLCVSIIDNVLQLSCYMSGQISKPVKAQSDLCLFLDSNLVTCCGFLKSFCYCPLSFRPSWDPKGRKKILLRPPALPPYLKVWIRHWLGCVTKFGKMQSLGTASKLSETKKKPLKTSKKGINNKENTKVRTDGPTWGRLKRIKIVGFWNLVRLTYF